MDNKPLTGEIVQEGLPIVPVKEDKKTKRKLRQAEIKKRKFIKRYLDCGNAAIAYMEVYKVKMETAQGNASNLLKSIGMDELLELHGVTDKALIDKLKEGLDATRPYGKNAKIHPDYATRHTYIETGLKLKKRLQPKEESRPIMQGLQIIINK